MAEILRPPSVTNDTEAYFGYTVTASDFDHVKVYFKNVTDGIVLFNGSVTSLGEFDYSVFNGYQPLTMKKKYRISFQPFDKIGNGGNIISWSWWVLNLGEFITVQNNTAAISNNRNELEMIYSVESSGVFDRINWNLKNAQNVIVASGTTPIVSDPVTISFPNLPDGVYTYNDIITFGTDTVSLLIDYVFQVDTIAPRATISNPPFHNNANTTLALTVSGDEPLYQYSYNLDNTGWSAWQAGGTLITNTVSANMGHTLAVKGRDFTLNTQLVSADQYGSTTFFNTYTWITDTTAPTAWVTPVAGYYNYTVTGTIFVKDNFSVSGCKVYRTHAIPPAVSGAVPTALSPEIVLSPTASSDTVSGTFISTNVTDGNYYNRFLIVDDAGNITYLDSTYVRDTVIPYYTLTPSAGSYNRPVTLNFNYVTPANEGGTILYYSLENTGATPVYLPYDSTHKPTLYEIDNYVKHYAVDLATNSTTVSSEYYEVDFFEEITGISAIIIDELITEEFGAFMTPNYFGYFDHKDLSFTTYNSTANYLKNIAGYDLDNIYFAGASPNGVNKVCLYTFDRTTKLTTYQVMPNLAGLAVANQTSNNLYTSKYDSTTGDIRLTSMASGSSPTTLYYYRVNKSNLMTPLVSGVVTIPLMQQALTDSSFIQSWENINKDMIVKFKIYNGGYTSNFCIYRIDEINSSSISATLQFNKIPTSNSSVEILNLISRYKEILIFNASDIYYTGLDLRGLNIQRYNFNHLYLNQPLSGDLVIGRTYPLITGATTGSCVIYNRDLYQNHIVVSNPNNVPITSSTTIGAYSVSASSVIAPGGNFKYITASTSADQFWYFQPESYQYKQVNVIYFDDNNNMLFNGGFKRVKADGTFWYGFDNFTLVVSASEFNNFTVNTIYNIKGHNAYNYDKMLVSKNYSVTDPTIMSLSFATTGDNTYNYDNSTPIIINNSVTALNWDKKIAPTAGNILRIDFKTNNNNIFDNPKIYNYIKKLTLVPALNYCSFSVTKRTLWFYGWANSAIASIKRERL
jgi:hypothetical protein